MNELKVMNVRQYLQAVQAYKARLQAMQAELPTADDTRARRLQAGIVVNERYYIEHTTSVRTQVMQAAKQDWEGKGSR